MEEYPRNLTELEANYSTEQACREYLSRLRWPDGFRCPRCQGGKSWPVRGVLLECAGCGCQTSVTAGTIFQDTRTPLAVWFRAMWWVTTQKNGASALGLQRVLGLKSYETAWTWLHKLRRAMVRPERDRLTGRVEVDESYLGGLEEGLRGRLTEKKALIVVAAEEDGTRIGRIRMRQIPDASAASLEGVPAGVYRAGQRDPYRWLAGLQWGHRERISPGGDGDQGKERDRFGVAAARAPHHLATETMANGNPPGCGEPQALGLLPGRIHVPIQSAKIEKPRQALLPPGTASGGHRSHFL